jgi:hypothetical protein
MMKTMLSAAAACMLVSAGAMAQNASKTEPAQTETGSAQAGNSGQASSGQTDSQNGKTMSIRQDMKESLQKAGFSGVHVVPDSFLVNAKDKDGHPVAMIINPHSMTEVVDEGPVGQMADNSGGGTAKSGAGNYTPYETGGTFTTVPKQEKLSSNIVGLSVYNEQNQDIGTIKDIAYTHHQVQAYIVGVGGFLGMGDRYVALNPSAVQLNWDGNSKQWTAKVDATADQLKSAPTYDYPNEG